MEGSNPKSSARLLGHPIHPMLVPFPIAFFTAVFLADLAYWLAPRPFWAEAGFWLLAAGLVGAALAAILPEPCRRPASSSRPPLSSCSASPAGKAGSWSSGTALVWRTHGIATDAADDPMDGSEA